MKYNFKDIYNAEMYNKSRVLFVTGSYSIFNNIATDNVKETCNGEVLHIHNSKLLKLLGDEEITISNSIDFENFKKLCRTPPITGRWYTVVDMSSIVKKGMDWVKEYIKNPSEFALLCIVSTQYKDYKFWLNNKIVNNTSTVNLIQLSWPYRDTVTSIATSLFQKRGRSIEPRAIELFTVRMGSEYDEYEHIVDKICNENMPSESSDLSKLPPLTYEEVLASMKGIESYGIDEFIEKMTQPLTSDIISGRKQVYRMLNYLIDSYGAKKLLSTIKLKIDDLILYREAINKGIIPILVDFSPAEAKKALGEESKLANKTDYRFRMEARLASKTSLNDWVYMSLILSATGGRTDLEAYEALYNLVSRSILNDIRLANAIRKEDTLAHELDYLDNFEYKEGVYNG